MADLLIICRFVGGQSVSGKLLAHIQSRGEQTHDRRVLQSVPINRARRGLTRLWCLLWHLTIYSFMGAVQAMATPVDLCDDAARHAAVKADVPTNVLRAIAKVETGRFVAGEFQAWPWTVNLEGDGYWFESEAAAHAFVRGAYARGVRSFDIGCFQINTRWHGAAFDSFESMFDPRENALYAARFLGDLRREMGTWSKAIGAYHSRQSQRAQGYRDRVEDIRAGLDGIPTQESETTTRQWPAEPVLSRNGYPLLQNSNGVARRGSLVPMGEARGYIIRFDQTVAVGF